MMPFLKLLRNDSEIMVPKSLIFTIIFITFSDKLFLPGFIIVEARSSIIVVYSQKVTALYSHLFFVTLLCSGRVSREYAPFDNKSVYIF